MHYWAQNLVIAMKGGGGEQVFDPRPPTLPASGNSLPPNIHRGTMLSLRVLPGEKRSGMGYSWGVHAGQKVWVRFVCQTTPAAAA